MPSTSWAYIVPLHNFQLDASVDPVLQIGRVHFVRAADLESVRTRFGIPRPIESYTDGSGSVLPDTKTLALVVQGGAADEVPGYARSLVNQAVEILACGMYGWARRWDRTGFGALPENEGTILEVLLDREEGGWRRSAAVAGSFGPVVVDAGWKNGADKYGSFFPMLRVLNDETQVLPNFRKVISTASAFAGRSWMSFPSLADSLLFGWIALELLLSNRNDDKRRTIPHRVEAILGVPCLGSARRGSVRTEVEILYDLRNALVHGADDSGITPQHVLFLDDVVHNVLGNVCRMAPTSGRDKASFLDFLVRGADTLHPGRGLQPHGRVIGCPRYVEKDFERPWVRVV